MESNQTNLFPKCLQLNHPTYWIFKLNLHSKTRFRGLNPFIHQTLFPCNLFCQQSYIFPPTVSNLKIQHNPKMYSNFIKRAIKVRLAAIRFGFCSMIHWDLKQDKLVPSSTYNKWNWLIMTSALGVLSVIFFSWLVVLLLNFSGCSSESEFMPAIAEQFCSKYGRMSLLHVMALVCGALTLCLSLIIGWTTLLTAEARRELCAVMDGCFRLDEKLSG